MKTIIFKDSFFNNYKPIMEIWKPLVYYSKTGKVYRSDMYLISTHGRIYSKLKKKIMKSRRTKNRKSPYYMKIGIFINKKQMTFLVYRLVASTFIINDNPLLLVEVNHKGIRSLDSKINNSDNKIDNLEWTSPSLNKRSDFIGRKINYFTEDELHLIFKSMSESGWSYQSIIDKLNKPKDKKIRLRKELSRMYKGERHSRIKNQYNIQPVTKLKGN